MGVKRHIRPSLRYRHRVDDAPYGIKVFDWYEYASPVQGPLRVVPHKAVGTGDPYLQVLAAAGVLVADCLVDGGEHAAAQEWVLNFVTLVVNTVEGGEWWLLRPLITRRLVLSEWTFTRWLGAPKRPFRVRSSPPAPLRTLYVFVYDAARVILADAHHPGGGELEAAKEWLLNLCLLRAKGGE